jgi:periplasmic copper chaperone A
VKGPYAEPHDYFGTKMTEGVIEVMWTGELPDEYYDEFVFRGMITDTLKPGAMLYFPAVQECATKVERWIEIPGAGQSEDDLEFPAPGIELSPAAGAGG